MGGNTTYLNKLCFGDRILACKIAYNQFDIVFTFVGVNHCRVDFCRSGWIASFKIPGSGQWIVLRLIKKVDGFIGCAQ